MKLTLIRHAPPIVHGICYGHSDVAVQSVPDHIIKEFRDQWLAANCPQIWSSPSVRCKDIATKIAGNENHLILFDERLRELHFGEWENVPWSDIPRAQLDEWGADWSAKAPPKGENFHQLCFRIDNFLSELNRKQAHWIISHAGPIRVILARLRQQDPTLYFETPIPHLETLHAP